jgi:hypothetical protein
MSDKPDGYPIWTMMRDGPFVLGGSSHWQPTYTTVPRVAGPYECEHDIRVLVVTCPDDTTRVIDASSNAIVGNNLESVREDIRTGDPAVMKAQMEQARAQFAKAKYMAPDQWWEKYLGAKR